MIKNKISVEYKPQFEWDTQVPHMCNEKYYMQIF